ncbi:MAG TPA: superoxide dismutase family protein [Stenotrophomonas sp.]
MAVNPLRSLALTGVVCALAACGSTPPKAPLPPLPPVPATPSVAKAEAALASASGSIVSGRVVLLPVPQGVRITGTVGGLRAGGSFGFHVHERGDCGAVDASSAGGHFNPTAAPHGRSGGGPHHLGDMDNLIADGEGVVHMDSVLGGVSLGGGAGNDILGRALIVHADPDDYRSQPSGNAGARLACGVIRATR